MIDEDLLERAAARIDAAPEDRGGEPIGTVLIEAFERGGATPDIAREIVGRVLRAAAKASLEAVAAGNRLSGDLVAKVDDGSADPGRAGCWAVDARVTGYEPGVLPSKRIDEIVLQGPVHFEMMDPTSAYLGVGDNQFGIGVREDGQLRAWAYDSSFDDGDGWDGAPVGTGAKGDPNPPDA